MGTACDRIRRAAESTVLLAGTRLHRYRILRPLGAGGMGEVYEAEDTRLKRSVAIKILPERLASDPARFARFEQEAQAVAALNHPNIVTIHSVEEDGERTTPVSWRFDAVDTVIDRAR
jgi:serine/threonine protein kinase